MVQPNKQKEAVEVTREEPPGPVWQTPMPALFGGSPQTDRTAAVRAMHFNPVTVVESRSRISRELSGKGHN